jgi:PIN domain nuclease of toxin-antitoxin system
VAQTAVADTHALVWHLGSPRRLAKGAKRAFAAADEGRWICYVPAIVLVEVALLHERGRIRITPAQVLDQLAGHPGYSVLPLDVEQALEFVALVGIKDPIDRLIAAAARATQSALISIDEAFPDGTLKRIWE